MLAHGDYQADLGPDVVVEAGRQDDSFGHRADQQDQLLSCALGLSALRLGLLGSWSILLSWSRLGAGLVSHHPLGRRPCQPRTLELSLGLDAYSIRHKPNPCGKAYPAGLLVALCEPSSMRRRRMDQVLAVPVSGAGSVTSLLFGALPYAVRPATACTGPNAELWARLRWRSSDPLGRSAVHAHARFAILALIGHPILHRREASAALRRLARWTRPSVDCLLCNICLGYGTIGLFLD